MRFYKKYFCLFLVFAVLLISVTGCSEKKEGNPFSYSNDIDENGFWNGVIALDYVDLYDYASFSIPSDTHNIPDDEVQNKLNTILQDYSTSEQITDRLVEDGDSVNIDYVGSVDGVEFSGGSTDGAGTEVTIGVTNYIDDFLEQLIGHKPGETFNVNVTFPEDYGQENLKGKDAVFVTTVNHIVKKITPELTDAFVVDTLSAEYGWETVSGMKDSIYADLQKEAIQGYIQTYIVDHVAVKSVPNKLVEYQKDAMIKYYQSVAEDSGMELEEFLRSYVGVASLDDLIESNSDNNMKSAKYSLVVQAIAEDAKITVTNEDITEYFKKELNTDDYSQYEEMYGSPYLKKMVLDEKVMNYLSEHSILEQS